MSQEADKKSGLMRWLRGEAAPLRPEIDPPLVAEAAQGLVPVPAEIWDLTAATLALAIASRFIAIFDQYWPGRCGHLYKAQAGCEFAR